MVVLPLDEGPLMLMSRAAGEGAEEEAMALPWCFFVPGWKSGCVGIRPVGMGTRTGGGTGRRGRKGVGEVNEVSGVRTLRWGAAR